MPIETGSYARLPAVAPNYESYRQPEGPSALDTVGKLQGLQLNDIQIDANKLKLVNERWGILQNELATWANDPNLDHDKVEKGMAQLVKQGLVPQNMVQEFTTDLPKDKTALKPFIEKTLQRGMSVMEKMNFQYGAPVTDDTGAQSQRGVVSVRPGFQARPIAAPVAKTIPPTTPVFDANNQERYQGEQPRSNIIAPPIVGTQPGARLPTGPVGAGVQGQSNNFGGNVTGATVEPDTLNDRFSAAYGNSPTGPKSGASPLFGEGKKQYVEDQNLATSKLTQIKPALQALPYLKDLRSGPGTEAWTKGIAFLKANGIVPIDSKDDKTAIYQEVSKKLAQYVSSNPIGQRSDSAQVLAEASSPSPKTQINPALIKLTKDAIILDRVQAARAGAFQGSNYEKYGEHASKFPASVDEKAFGLDLMEPKERDDLLDSMFKKKNTFEGQKFWKSYKIVKDQGLIDVGNSQ